MTDPRNVLGEPLAECCTKPMTGFYRDGSCNTGPEDFGVHTVCTKVDAAFPCGRRPALPPREALAPDIAARWEAEVAYVERIRGASIYPAVQNIILACRALGLGTVITTNHIRCEDEVKALLGIPEEVSTFALMPIGWPLDRFGPLTRRPLDEVAHADRWETAWPG